MLIAAPFDAASPFLPVPEKHSFSCLHPTDPAELHPELSLESFRVGFDSVGSGGEAELVVLATVEREVEPVEFRGDRWMHRNTTEIDNDTDAAGRCQVCSIPGKPIRQVDHCARQPTLGQPACLAD